MLLISTLIAAADFANFAAPDVADSSVAASGLAGRVIELFVLISALSIAPAIAMMATSLPLIVIVLSILRQGSGLQQSPPNMMIMGLAIALTWFVMQPSFSEAWREGLSPYLSKTIEAEDAAAKVAAPFRRFMENRVDPFALSSLTEARGATITDPTASPDLSLLAPAFMLSEIQRAIQIGFVILLPFLIIDLLIASILMAMGMMMVPPAIVSLPFKLAFLVLTNGWVAVSSALVSSYS